MLCLTLRTLLMQPTKSPDLNLLDLGVWYSLASCLPSVACSEVPIKKVHSSSFINYSHDQLHERIIDIVMWGWNLYDPQHLHYITDTKMRVVKAVYENDGSHFYKIPRSKERKRTFPGLIPYNLTSLSFLLFTR